MLCNLSTYRLQPLSCMTAVEWQVIPSLFVTGEKWQCSSFRRHLVALRFFTCARGGSANSLWTRWLGGPDSRSDTLHWTVGTWRKEQVLLSANIMLCDRFLLTGVPRNSAIGVVLYCCLTYLSSRFLCLRMRWTSAAVAGPCSFWPFSISFSSSSMDWTRGHNHAEVWTLVRWQKTLYFFLMYESWSFYFFKEYCWEKVLAQ